MNKNSIQEWFRLSEATRKEILINVANDKGISEEAVEKDWWVVHTLFLVFQMQCKNHLLFKGGTSLSKGWNLIKRFSEDIDLALDRAYLGFGEKISKNQIKNNLRPETHKFIKEKFRKELQEQFNTNRFTNVEVKVKEGGDGDQDPTTLEIYYPKLTIPNFYIKPDILIEIGSRSMKEPFTQKSFSSMVAEKYKEQVFADLPILVPCVNPERTFLEKILLLHEEFTKETSKIRVNRLSRHLYDIYKIGSTEYKNNAFQDSKLFDTIVAHRKLFTPIKSTDYDHLKPNQIQFIPSDAFMKPYEEDYKQMQEMIYEEEILSFNDLITELKKLEQELHLLT